MNRLRMNGIRAGLQAAVLTAGVVFLAGCHTYRVVENPPPGSVVRVRIPVQSPLNNRTEDVLVEGQLLDNGDTISLATETRRQLGAYSELMQHDTLRLASDRVTSFELKEFSTGKSIALGVVIAGGATLAALFGFGGGGGEVPNPPIPPQTTVVNQSLLSTVWGLIAR